MNGTIDIHDDGRMRHVTLRRKTRANAFSIDMLDALTHAIAMASSCSGTVDAIVLQAEGANFCAGADMSELKTRRDAQYDALRALIAALDARRPAVLCVLHGKTLGAGCLLPALADAVIASDDATLGFPEMHFGMYPSLMHAVLAQKLPSPLVHALCVSARVLGAHECAALGLVTDVLDARDFVARSRERVAFYAARASALRYGREMLRKSAGETLLDRVDRARGIIDRNLSEQDVGARLASYRK